jgi:hypothetical protein
MISMSSFVHPALLPDAFYDYQMQLEQCCNGDRSRANRISAYTVPTLILRQLGAEPAGWAAVRGVPRQLRIVAVIEVEQKGEGESKGQGHRKLPQYPKSLSRSGNKDEDEIYDYCYITG